MNHKLLDHYDSRLTFVLLVGLPFICFLLCHCQYQMTERVLSAALEALKRHLVPQQHVLDLITVTVYQSKPSQQILAMTTASLHLIHYGSHRKLLHITNIKCITLATFSTEMVIHTIEEDLRLQSYINPKIISNILLVKEKVLKETGTLTAFIERCTSLEQFTVGKASRFWSGWFGKKESDSNRFSQRKSYCALEVTAKDYLVAISKQMYSTNYKDVELLYISGASGFFLNQMNYNCEQIDYERTLMKHRVTGDVLIMTKLTKTGTPSDNRLKELIKQYKLDDTRQELHFGIETGKTFELIAPLPNGRKTAFELLLQDQHYFSQMDLVSVFYALMRITEGQQHILYSLGPRHILLSSDGVRVAVICAADKNKPNLAYLSPQEICDYCHKVRPQLTNLWKIGMLLYEMAFACLPFPLEYLSFCLHQKKKIALRFPPGRGSQFSSFIKQILIVNPDSRCKADWRKKLFGHPWVLGNMK